MSRLLRCHPLLRVLLAQCLALLGVALGMFALAKLGGGRPLLWQAALAQGVLAALLGLPLALRRGWLVFNLLCLPALLALAASALPSWVPALAFALLLALNWNGLRERVPLYLSGAPAERALTELLEPLPPGFAFVDLGCGLGGLLARLARRYPQGRFVGVETAPLSFLIAWLRCLPRRNCQVRYLSLWQLSLEPFDLVYCFLSPAPMARLWEKAQAEMRPAAWLVSNSFAVPGVAPLQQRPLHDWRASQLLLWRPGEGRAAGPLR